MQQSLTIDYTYNAIRKKSSVHGTHLASKYHKKYIRNSRKLIKEKTRAMVLLHVNRWLVLDTPRLTEASLQDYLKCLKLFFKLMKYKFGSNLLLAAVIYADKFVQKQGSITENQLFNLLMISSIIAVKYWEDYGDFDFKTLEYVSGIPKKTISTMERTFLGTLDYSLFLSATDIESRLQMQLPEVVF